MSTYVFQATDAVNGTELWITDGTDAGTMLLKDIYAGATNSTPGNFFRLADGKVLFAATDAVSGNELWVTDGTAAGTTLFKDINPLAASSGARSIGLSKAMSSLTVESDFRGPRPRPSSWRG